MDRDYETINAYIEKFVDEWHCFIDHEDGSTAPFSSLAIKEVSDD